VAVIDFDQPDTLRAAFHGSRKASIGLGTTGRRVQDEVALIDAAVAAGASRRLRVDGLVAGEETFSAGIDESGRGYLAGWCLRRQ
jgi:hypothetical protein